MFENDVMVKTPVSHRQQYSYFYLLYVILNYILVLCNNSVFGILNFSVNTLTSKTFCLECVLANQKKFLKEKGYSGSETI